MTNKKEKIVIINQPLSNRGDEAAHRSLMRALDKQFPSASFTVLFINQNKNDINEFVVNSSHITYININIKGSKKVVNLLQRWSLRLNSIYLSFSHPTIRKYANIIKQADIVICAMGGINMGGFQDWGHIFNLALAKYFKKELIYYSRSFGPFPTKTQWNRVFKRVSYKLLKSFDFLSIRDYKTAELANKLELTYIQSIDTAFLDTPETEIPIEIKKIINDENFIILVPNSLTWHTAYKNRKQESIDSFFVEILELLLSKNNKIIMLPQLNKYVTYSEPDYAYFCKLKDKVENDNVVVLSDTYSSDIQQKIIERANCVIGARYHSIVFAINNCTPFISLSYEHKMTGLLQLLKLQDFEINISNIGERSFNKNASLYRIERLLDCKHITTKEAKEEALNIATNTFEKLTNFINSN